MSVLVHKHASSLLQGSKCYPPSGKCIWACTAMAVQHRPGLRDFLKYAHSCMHEARAPLAMPL